MCLIFCISVCLLCFYSDLFALIVLSLFVVFRGSLLLLSRGGSFFRLLVIYAIAGGFLSLIAIFCSFSWSTLLLKGFLLPFFVVGGLIWFSSIPAMDVESVRIVMFGFSKFPDQFVEGHMLLASLIIFLVVGLISVHSEVESHKQVRWFRF